MDNNDRKEREHIMKKCKSKLVFILYLVVTMLTSVASVGTSSEVYAAKKTPFKTHGTLKVKGTNLVDKNGKVVQLRGVSTHGLSWFPEYVNKAGFKTLRDDWNVNCIRLAMYTEEYAGYCSGGNQAELKALVKKGVKAATELGMYVIVDWHILNDGNPLTHVNEAKAFFQEMSKEFKKQDNVIYEICNEPNGSVTWSDVKKYANKIIPVIRKNDKNAIVLVGSPTWSQDTHEAVKSPLKYQNVMYTLHFYASTHKDFLRDRLKKCRKQGLPIFISEFGICDASGNGAIDYKEANEWKKLIDKYKISHVCWNLSNKAETSSLISSTCSKISNWKYSELSNQGKWIRKWMKSKK